jgi:gag-polypeptide of LTR copia-type
MSQTNDRLTSIVLTGNKNYVPWSRSVFVALKGRWRLGFITGTNKEPIPEIPEKPTEAEQAKIKDWQVEDYAILTLLLNTLDTPFIACSCTESHQKNCGTTKMRYGKQKFFAHIFSLKQEITRIKQGNKSNSELVTELSSKWEELQTYLPPTTDPIEAQKRIEQDLIFTYLRALDSSYETARSQILLLTEMSSFDDVIAIIDQEETRRTLMNPQAPELTENKAFQVQQSNQQIKPSFVNPSFRDSARQRGGPSSERCDHCNRAGHSRDRCWILHPPLRPNRVNRDKGGKWSNTRKWEKGKVAYLGEMGFDLKDSNAKGSDQSAYSSNSSAEGIGSAGAASVQLARLFTQLLVEKQKLGFVLYKSNSLNSLHNSAFILKIANLCQNKNNWVIDSGASDHVTWDKNILQNYQNSKESQHVTIANGNKV